MVISTSIHQTPPQDPASPRFLAVNNPAENRASFTPYACAKMSETEPSSDGIGHEAQHLYGNLKAADVETVSPNQF